MNRSGCTYIILGIVEALPGAFNAGPAGEREALHLLQLRALLFVTNFPEVQSVVIQQRQNPPL